MASVPAEVQSGAQLPATPAVPEQAPSPVEAGQEPHNELIFGFSKLTLMRQLVLVVGVAACLAMCLAVILWMQEPSYRPLLNNINDYSPTEVAQILQQNKISYKIEPNSGVLLVEADALGEARLKLAAAGISEDRTIGFELMDKDSGLGTSQFMETTRYRRGLEGELARTITSLRNVRSARVHLAIPKQSVFVRDNRKPSASIFVELMGARELDREQVEAIVNLVASSVPEMDRKDITLVDQRGRLLSQNHRSSEDLIAMQQFEYARKMEETLNSRISSILEPVMGPGKFRSEVSAELDFTSIEQAEEIFNPDTNALRSEQTLSEQRVAGQNGGVPGALSNQPPGAATVPEQATDGAQAQSQTGDMRTQATRNYEVDRTVSYTKHEKGRLKRLTVAVVVDDIRRTNPATGEVSYQPWPEAELQRLTQLVRDAVGYSAARGDSVNVINTPFAPAEEIPLEAISWWEQPWAWQLAKYGVGTLIILVLVLGLLRLLNNLVNPNQGEKTQDLTEDEQLAELQSLAAAAGESGQDEGSDFLLPGGSTNLERQLNALKGLIAEDPGRVAQVVRQWINSDE